MLYDYTVVTTHNRFDNIPTHLYIFKHRYVSLFSYLFSLYLVIYYE